VPLHTAETLSDGHRVTLVMSLRSAAQPWKDGNTLSRLLRDDRPEDVAANWCHDVDTRQLPALRSFLLSWPRASDGSTQWLLRRRMVDHKVRRLLVIDGRELVGIVAVADAARAMDHPDIGLPVQAISAD
jgi:hypothetical protein